MPATSTTPIVVSALTLRTRLGSILRRVTEEGRSLVVEGGTPAAVLLNLRDYVKLAAPEPEILKIIGAEAKRNKTTALTPRQIDRIIQSARSAKKKR